MVSGVLMVNSSAFSMMKKESEFDKLVKQVKELEVKRENEVTNLKIKNLVDVEDNGAEDYNVCSHKVSQEHFEGAKKTEKGSRLKFWYPTQSYAKLKKGFEALAGIDDKLFSLAKCIGRIIPESDNYWQAKEVYAAIDKLPITTRLEKLNKDIIEKAKDRVAKFEKKVRKHLTLKDIRLEDVLLAWGEECQSLENKIKNEYGIYVKRFLDREATIRRIEREMEEEEAKKKVIPKNVKREIIEAAKKFMQAKQNIADLSKKLYFYDENENDCKPCLEIIYKKEYKAVKPFTKKHLVTYLKNERKKMKQLKKRLL